LPASPVLTEAGEETMLGARFTVAAALALVLAGSARAGEPSDGFDAYFKKYWDPSRGEFYRFADHHADGSGKEFADYWWQAHMFETVIAEYQVTGSREDKERIATVLHGFLANHPDWKASALPLDRNRFNDDLGWWALACLHAYEATGDRAYLDQAKKIYGKITPPGRDGAVPWTAPKHFWEPSITNGDDRNIATNGLYIQISAKLSLYDPEHKARDLERARGAKKWIEKNLVEPDDPHGIRVNDTVHADGSKSDAQFSYNYGNLIGADLALYDATGDKQDLAEAEALARSAIARTEAGARGERWGIHPVHGDGADDGAGFGQILDQNLATLARSYGQTWIQPFLDQQAQEALGDRRPGSFGANGDVEARITAILAARPAEPAPDTIPGLDGGLPRPPVPQRGAVAAIERAAAAVGAETQEAVADAHGIIQALPGSR
jgi:predicted alpha-1,6-mannanase (GH76 family)